MHLAIQQISLISILFFKTALRSNDAYLVTRKLPKKHNLEKLCSTSGNIHFILILVTSNFPNKYLFNCLTRHLLSSEKLSSQLIYNCKKLRLEHSHYKNAEFEETKALIHLSIILKYTTRLLFLRLLVTFCIFQHYAKYRVMRIFSKKCLETLSENVFRKFQIQKFSVK